MNAKEKERLRRILMIVFAVLVLVYIVYQVYLVTHSSVETQVVTTETVNDSVDTDVFVVRNEKTISSSGNGTIISVISDGSRVAKGEEVAAVFSDTKAAGYYARMSKVTEELSRYKRLNSQKTSYAVDVSAMNATIAQDVIDIVEIVDSGNLSDLEDAIYTARDDAITEQIATGQDLDLDAKLSELRTQYKKLQKKGTTHSSLTAESSGYYSSSVDGYESTASYSKVAKMTVEDIEKILDADPKEVSDKVIGKIYASFDWYMLCIVPTNKTSDLGVGDSVTVNFPSSAVSTVPATVYAVTSDQSKDESAVVLKCNRMDSGIATLRKEEAELVLYSYTGIKVNSEAVRVNDDGEKGVYVKEGNIARFKKLDIVYSGEDFVLSTPHDESGYVEIYDNVILGGKGLYDGAVVS